MKFRFTYPSVLFRGQMCRKMMVFAVGSVSATVLMVALMGFLIPPNSFYTEGWRQPDLYGNKNFPFLNNAYTEGWRRLLSNEKPLFVAPSETCAEAAQICSGVTISARTNVVAVESGPYYGCLGSAPNPTWLYVKIATSGTLSFSMAISPAADMDFIAWGPFTDVTCGAALTAAKLKGCDYTAANGGTANLGNVVAGEYYMVMMTNYSNVNGNLAVTVGAGSTATIACPSPGGTNLGLKIWFKADAGTNTTTNGAAISQWIDQSGQGKNATQGTAANQPLFVSNGTNFNPALNYDGANDYLVNTTVGITGGDKTFFAVAVPTSLPAGTVGILGAGGLLNESQFGYQNGLLNTYENVGNNALATTAASVGVPVLSTGMEAANAISFFHNGTANGTGSYNSTPSTIRFSVGAHTVGGAGLPSYKNFWQGTISEVIQYESALSATNREKIESYLGLKYGITLGHDYVNSGGTVFWDKTANSAFHNNVAGIGRDDIQGLHQKQSKSVNTNGIVTMGLKNIATTNPLNTNMLANGTYLMFGDDGVAAGATAPTAATVSACTPAVGLDAFFNRKWKVVETGTVDSTLLRVAAASLTGLTATQPIYLVTADDAAFTTNVKYKVMTVNGANREVKYNFNGTQYFTFSGTGTTNTYCTGSSYLRWATQGWTAGSLTKNVTLNGGLTMNTTLTDPNSIIAAGYPRLYNGLPMTYINTKNAAHAVTWTSVFNQKVSGVSFSVYDIDNVGTLMEHIDVKGYNGATLVNPTFTRPLVSSVTASGTTVSGSVNNVPTYSPFAKVNVSFNQTIDKVVITYKNNKNTFFKRGAAMLLSDFSVYCPEPVVTPDLVALSKMAPTGNYNIGDTLTYTFKLNNADCAAKTVNFSDVLPTGFTWVDNSYISPIVGGTLNTYAGTNTLTVTGLNVPVGITTFTADVVVGGTAGTKNNQASIIVPTGTNTTILSDDPLQAGAADMTPVITVAPAANAPLSITKSINTNSTTRTGTVMFTYSFNNTNASSITTEFLDELQLDTASYRAGSLTLGAGLTGTPNAYGGDATLSFASLVVPVGTSSFTVQVDMNNVSVGTYKNTATILPTSGSFRQLYKTSNEVPWTVITPFYYAYNCLGSNILGTFIANGVAGQTGSLTIPLDGSYTGATAFTVTATGFTGTLATTIVAGQSSVTIPIVYDGTGTEGSRLLTVTSPQGAGSCTSTAIIQAACKADGGQIGTH